jgi:hypothetical protein
MSESLSERFDRLNKVFQDSLSQMYDSGFRLGYLLGVVSASVAWTVVSAVIYYMGW